MWPPKNPVFSKNVATTAAISVLAALFLLLCLKLFALQSLNADAANALLQAEDIDAGNWRLKGWWLAPDNCFGLDEFLLCTVWALAKDAALTLRLVPALAWLLLALSTLWLVLEKTSTARWQRAIMLLALIFLPVPGRGETSYYGLPCLHILTATSIMATLWICARLNTASAQPHWLWLLLGLLATNACASDPMFFYVGTIPILAATAIALHPNRRNIFGIMLAAAIAAHLLLYWNQAHGGFVAYPPSLGLIPLRGIIPALELMGVATLATLRCDPFGTTLLAASYALFRLPLLIRLLLATLRTSLSLPNTWRQKPAPGFIETALCLITLADVAAMLISNAASDLESSRFLLPAWAASAALAARLYQPNKREFSYYAATALLALASDVQELRTTAPPPLFPAESYSIAASLEAHHLAAGYTSYWLASSTAVASGGKVQPRAVLVNQAGQVRPFEWVAKSQWYQGDPRTKQFFVMITRQPRGLTPGLTITPNVVFKTFGPPDKMFTSGDIIVFIYNGPLPALPD